MTMLCVPIMIPQPDAVPHALHRAEEAKKSGANLVEWRVDTLIGSPEGIEAISQLCGESPLPCLITCRSREEGGSYEQDDVTYAELFETITEMSINSGSPPRYLDVEWRRFARSEVVRTALQNLKETQADRDLSTTLIFSSHDFQGRPPTLMKHIAAMANEPLCDVIKVAWMARSLRDNLEAFELLQTRTKPMIALCMGDCGLMSRVLAPKFGGLLTFATDARGDESAPGQPTLDDLKNLYRFSSLNPETKIYGIIGWPVTHSRSPQVHNAGFHLIGHDGVYLPLPIPPEWEHFKATVGELIDSPFLNFRGASVTIPHKEHLVRFLEERGGRLDHLSKQIGAANTLIVGATGAIGGWNTDGSAAVETLIEGMGISQEALSEKSVAILGAGGVARSIAGSLIECGCSITIFNRNHQRAEQLVMDLNSPLITVGETDQLADAPFNLIINCTSIGMENGPAPEKSPLEVLAGRPVPVDFQSVYFDTIYTPQQTPFLRHAEEQGATAISGLEMFRRQAAKQFALWTEHPEA